MDLRNYQKRTVSAVHANWMGGSKRVLVVSPTSSGKTLIGATCVREKHTLWVAHRRELVEQTAEKLELLTGERVDRIMPGGKRVEGARFHVGTVQTLLERDVIPGIERLVQDEAHHFSAAVWSELADRYPGVPLVGLTATPERDNGRRALGDVFDSIVVAAQHSELLAGGFIVPLRVIQPMVDLGNDLAADPVEAWADHSEGAQTIVFTGRVDDAYRFAKAFRARQIRAGTLDGATPGMARRDGMEQFRSGKTKVMTNAFLLTEGIDIPDVRVVMLARSFRFVGAYLQACGRPSRPADGKRDGIIIDLTGATIRHGAPDQDREYSLEGTPIVSTARAVSVDREVPEWNQSIVKTALVVASRGALQPGEEPTRVTLPPLRTMQEIDWANEQSIAKRHGRNAADFYAKYQARFR